VTGPAYAAARAVARKVELHFAHHQGRERERGRQDIAPKPDAAVIEAVVEAAFWASLRREENYPPRISLAFLPPEQAGRPLLFERALPLTPEALTRLAPAVERPGIHLGVWRDGGELLVWGATRTLPALCFALEVVAPGLLVIKHRREEGSGKFVNVAVLEADRIKILDHQPMPRPDYPALVASLLGFDAPEAAAWSVNALIQLAVSMRAHGRGGALLLAPHGSEEWRESIVGPVLYSVSPPFTGLADLLQQGASHQDALRRAVDAVAGLTAVDGAMVLTDRCEVLAFGAKIGRRTKWPRIERVLEIEPVEGVEPRLVHPAETGGARHLSAAQFAHDQRNALAMVASQDGRFTIMAWSAVDEVVQAYRVETLLM
jgi:sensor domain DACNV-containing protein